MRKALLVFFAALAVRSVPVAFACFRPQLITLDKFDTQQYRHLALNMLERGIFSSYPAMYFVRRQAPYEPEAFRLPGYPLFLALSFALFGPDPWFAVALQALLTSLGAVALFGLGRELLGERAGLAAGLLYALEPLSATMNAYLFPDALLGGLLAAFLLVYWNYLKKGGWWRSALIGSLAGFAVWVKPWPVFLFPVLFLLKPKREILLALSAFGVFVGGWAFRNWRVFGVPALSGVSAYNLYIHHWGSVWAMKQGLDPQGGSVQFGNFVRDSVPPDNALKMVSRWGKRSIDSILAHPADYFKVHALFTVKLLTDSREYWALFGTPPRTGFLRALFGQEGLRGLREGIKALLKTPSGWLGLFSTFYALALFALGIFGILKLLRGKGKIFALGIALSLAYFIFSPGPSARSRMRTAWVPFAAVAAASLFEKRRQGVG